MSGQSTSVDLIGAFKDKRRPRSQAVPGVVCGRRTCQRCRRWRHVCYFSAMEWADAKMTKPKRFRGKCDSCQRVLERTRERVRQLEKDRQEPRRRPAPVVVNVISGYRPRALTKAEDVEEMLEGVLPIVGFSLADEDYDPTPVPTGCHRCWRTGGEPCFRCSDDADAMASWEAEKAGVRKGRRARCAS